jgi:hypothetical protein
MTSAFREVFGDTTRIRVIEALSDGIVMTSTEWAKEADVNIKYVYKELPWLRRMHLVRRYVNEDHPHQRLYVWDNSTPLAKMIRKCIVTLALAEMKERREDILVAM